MRPLSVVTRSKLLQDPAVEPPRRARKPALAEQADLESGTQLEVLHVQPSLRPRETCCKQAHRGGERGRLDHEQGLRSMTQCSIEHGRGTGQGKGEEMQNAGEGLRPAGDPQGAADHAHAAPGLGRPAPARASRIKAPVRVVGVGGDHGHLVALAHQALGHLAGVLADAGQLGREVEAVEQPATAGGGGRARVERAQDRIDGRECCGRHEPTSAWLSSGSANDQASKVGVSAHFGAQTRPRPCAPGSAGRATRTSCRCIRGRARCGGACPPRSGSRRGSR